MKREYTKSVAHTVKTSGVMIIWNICRLELKKLKHTAPQELQKQNTSNILAHKDIFFKCKFSDLCRQSANYDAKVALFERILSNVSNARE